MSKRTPAFDRIAPFFSAGNPRQICLPPSLFSLPGEQKFPADHHREFAKKSLDITVAYGSLLRVMKLEIDEIP
jgi:hypothetical protein